MSKILALMVLALSLIGCASSVTKSHTTVTQPTFDPIAHTVLVRVKCADGSGWGSGTIYQNNRVLTAAHVVDDDSCVTTVERAGERAYNAVVLRRDVKADLAILVIDGSYTDLNFEVGQSKLDQDITCVGFPVQPTDEDNPRLSVSRGTILSIDVPDGDGILVNRTNAAILFGSSGGGCFSGGKLIGVADSLVLEFQDYKYLLRSEDIQKFISTDPPLRDAPKAPAVEITIEEILGLPGMEDLLPPEFPHPPSP